MECFFLSQFLIEEDDSNSNGAIWKIISPAKVNLQQLMTKEDPINKGFFRI
jgi:hypothetical protein